MLGSGFSFAHARTSKRTISLNEGVIADEESFERYEFMEPEDCDYSGLKNVEAALPDGMKAIVWSNGGVLENVISLVGYENLSHHAHRKPAACRPPSLKR